MPNQRLSSQKLDNTEHDAGVKSVGVRVWDTNQMRWIKWGGDVFIDASQEIFALFGSLEDANYDYIAEQASDGRWRIMRIDKTTELVTYAFGEAPVPAQTDWATQTYGAWR